MLMISSYCILVSIIYRKYLIYVMVFWKNIFWNIMLARVLPFAMANPEENISDLYALMESAYARKHLWNIWGISLFFNGDDVKYKKRLYISSVNKLNCQFPFASRSTRTKLLQTYFSAWYGSQNLQLHTEAVCGFHTEWNKAIRRTLGLPPRTRNILLPHLAGNQSYTRQVECRWLLSMYSDKLKWKYILRKKKIVRQRNWLPW